MKISLQDAVLYSLLFGLLLLAVPRAGFGPDVQCWTQWAKHSHAFGLGAVYQLPSNNYNPFYHYILAGYAGLLKTDARIEHFRHGLKAVTLLFDFVGVLAAVSFVQDRARRFALSGLLLFNIAYLYNTLIWEQIDAIHTCFVFLALVVTLRRRLLWGVAFFVLAFNTKMQAVIFLPLLLLLWLPAWGQAPRLFFASVTTALLLQLALLAPFVWSGPPGTMGRIIAVNLGSVGFDATVSSNAYNGWFLFLYQHGPSQLQRMSDLQTYAGVSYRHWGLGLFLAGAALALLPAALVAGRQLVARQEVSIRQAPLFFLTGGLIAVLFAYFNTEMHERYWHPCILFFGAYAFATARYWLLVLSSLAYYLNLEATMQYLYERTYDQPGWLFEPRFVALLFAAVLLYGFFRLYKTGPIGPALTAVRRQLRARTAGAHLSPAGGSGTPGATVPNKAGRPLA